MLREYRMANQENLLAIYKILFSEYGNRNWWPADTPFEVIIGAILTQNVSWNNVEKAINNLKNEEILTPEKLHKTEVSKIALLIKPSRFYNQKARKIKNFMSFFIDKYEGNISKMSKDDTIILRKNLLQIPGLGEETVDSILLYACDKPIFVVDAYTKRIFSRYGIIDDDSTYGITQAFFMENLPGDIELYNDFHAQIVHLGNKICKTHPKCEYCPIRKIDDKIKCRYYSENP
jgi:endonuclease III related protein